MGVVSVGICQTDMKIYEILHFCHCQVVFHSCTRCRKWIMTEILLLARLHSVGGQTSSSRGL